MEYVAEYTALTVSIRYTPEFFRQAAQKYNAANQDRAAWLKAQIINLEAAIMQYKTALEDLQEQAASLDGVNNVATWMSRIGAVVTMVPGVYTQVIGAVVSVAGTIWNALERKKDTKSAQKLYGEFQKLQAEAQAIQTYYSQYKSELQRITIMPYLLAGGIAWALFHE